MLPTAFNRNDKHCLDGQITSRSTYLTVSGGCADIWEGFFGSRKVAIKVVRPFASTGMRIKHNKLLKRLWREYLAWSCLSHPNILECLGFSYDFSPDSYPFPSLISPWMTNGTIISYLEDYPETDRLELLVGIAEGLSYLHARTQVIIHGDLRAGNVLVSDHGIPCLSDFGLSRVLSKARGMTTSDEVAGSMRWMSPELFQDCSAVTVHSDVWAYGMTVLEILSGKRPYAAFKNDVFVLRQISDGQIPLKPEKPTVLKVLSEGLWSLCLDCWSLEPIKRPSMRDVLSRLRNEMAEQQKERPEEKRKPLSNEEEEDDKRLDEKLEVREYVHKVEDEVTEKAKIGRGKRAHKEPQEKVRLSGAAIISPSMGTRTRSFSVPSKPAPPFKTEQGENRRSTLGSLDLPVAPFFSLLQVYNLPH